jgi:acyl carrier protein
VVLKSLPLTPNGKVDRKALPEPERDRSVLKTPFSAPGTEVERTIAGIWEELLGIKNVGLQDNFFDLGGHSLLAVQAQARIRTALGVDLPVVKVFQYPTVKSLAGYLNREEEQPRASSQRGSLKQAAYAKRARREQEALP